MSVLSEVLITLAVITTVFTLTSVLIVRTLLRRMRRSRALSRGVLRTRAHLRTGPQRKVLKLRVRLNDALDSAQAALTLAMQSDGPRGELPQLFRRIRREGLALELQLRLMESDIDFVSLAETIPVATRRVDEVAGMVSRLRSAISAGLGTIGDDSFRALSAEVEREVEALNAGVQELSSLNSEDYAQNVVLHPAFDQPPKGNKL